MAAYIDEYRNRFKVGPICRVLSESLGCGFLAPRGYRMVESRPVSRMRARHEALARGSAVYGYRKVWHGLIGKGWDPGEVGRDQVMNIMRGLGIRGVRRGKTPVATKPAKGTDGRPDLMDRKFEAGAPNRPHVATSPTCAWPTGASRIPHSSPTCSSGGSWAGRASPP